MTLLDAFLAYLVGYTAIGVVFGLAVTIPFSRRHIYGEGDDVPEDMQFGVFLCALGFWPLLIFCAAAAYLMRDD